MKTKQRIAVLGTACVMAASIALTPTAAIASEMSHAVSITDGPASHGFVRTYKSLFGLATKSLWNYNRKSINVNGTQLSVNGFTANGVEYVPFRAMANAIGASYSYDSKTRTATMRKDGLIMTATDANYTVYANDRPIFSLTPSVIMSDGRLYVPIDSFVKATGLAYSGNQNRISVSGNYNPLKSASAFYREDEVLWLARIIHAEASGEPLLGKIAVGNVVLNRVRSPEYPNTIYGVIFDRKYGVQFSPILNGTIYNTPTYNSVLAAKICLEGFDVSDGALFFLQPRLATSSWIPKSREYSFTIGGHDFYK